MSKLAIFLGCLLFAGTAAAEKPAVADRNKADAAKTAAAEKPTRENVAAEKPARPQAQVEKLTIAGKLLQENRTVKDNKSEEERVVSFYVLELPDGRKVRLPPVKPTDNVDYASFADQQVSISGDGIVQQRDEKTHIMLRKVDSIIAAGAILE